MNIKKKLVTIVLAVAIMAAGTYSFSYLDYLTLANPVKIVLAIQSLGQSSGTTFEKEPGSTPEQQHPTETMHGSERGKRGPESGGDLSIAKVAAFFGVFLSTAAAAYGIDQLFRKRKIQGLV